MSGPALTPIATAIRNHTPLLPAGECWPWQGNRKPSGYGRVYIGHSKYALAHRVAYELANGPIPADLTIDHLCRNRSCVNPAHMEAVSRAENTMRGDTLGARNAAKTRCKRGHLLDDANTYLTRQGWRRCRQCHNERNYRSAHRAGAA